MDLTKKAWSFTQDSAVKMWNAADARLSNYGLYKDTKSKLANLSDRIQGKGAYKEMTDDEYLTWLL